MTFIDENWPCRINLAPQCIMQANYHTLFLLRTQFFKRNTIYTCSCLTCRWIRIQFNITRVKQTWNLWYNIVFIDNNVKKKRNLIVELNVYMYIHHKKWSTRGQHHHLSYNSHIKLNELYVYPQESWFDQTTIYTIWWCYTHNNFSWQMILKKKIFISFFLHIHI